MQELANRASRVAAIRLQSLIAHARDLFPTMGELPLTCRLILLRLYRYNRNDNKLSALQSLTYLPSYYNCFHPSPFSTNHMASGKTFKKSLFIVETIFVR